MPSIDLVRIKDGVITVQNMKKGFKDSETSARARGFRSMMGKFAKYVRLKSIGRPFLILKIHVAP